MSDVEVFRPKTNLLWAGLAYFLIMIFALQSIFFPTGSENYLVDALVCGAVSTVSYLIWIRPKLILENDLLRVVNPFSTIIIRYEDIEGLETRWCLQIVHSGTHTDIWVAPKSGRRAARSRQALRIKGTVGFIEQSLGDSEVAAQLIQRHLNSH
jgi:hypothetical protein